METFQRNSLEKVNFIYPSKHATRSQANQSLVTIKKILVKWSMWINAQYYVTERADEQALLIRCNNALLRMIFFWNSCFN